MAMRAKSVPISQQSFLLLTAASFTSSAAGCQLGGSCELTIVCDYGLACDANSCKYSRVIVPVVLSAQGGKSDAAHLLRQEPHGTE